MADTYSSYVSSLLHFNGTNNSTTFTDEVGNTVNYAGNAKISTSQSVFSGASGSFDGTNSIVTIPAGSRFNFGSLDWTIELWFRKTGSSTKGLFGTRPAGLFGPLQLDIVSSKIKVLVSTGSGSWTINSTGTTTISTGTWYHVAAVRNKSNFTLYLNGNSEITSSALSTSVVTDMNTNVYIGWESDCGYFDGYIDECRITKGIARYTSTFTPPAAEFTYEGGPSTSYIKYSDDLRYKLSGEFLSHAAGKISGVNITSANYYDGGTSTVTGTVTYNGSPAKRKVRLFTLKDARCIAETWSDSTTGVYTFTRLKNQEYIVTGEDYLREFDFVTHLVANS